MKQNQKGFGAVEILVVIVVVGLLGTVGWLVYDRQKSPKQNNTVQQSSNTSTQEKAKPSTDTQVAQATYLTLEDFKVRIPLGDKTSKLKLGKVGASSYSESEKSVLILAPELDSIWKCEADQAGSKGTIGTISITTQSKRSGPYEPLATKKIGTYTYGFEAGGSNCTDSPLYKELVDAFKTQFEQMQAY